MARLKQTSEAEAGTARKPTGSRATDQRQTTKETTEAPATNARDVERTAQLSTGTRANARLYREPVVAHFATRPTNDKPSTPNRNAHPLAADTTPSPAPNMRNLTVGPITTVRGRPATNDTPLQVPRWVTPFGQRVRPVGLWLLIKTKW